MEDSGLLKWSTWSTTRKAGTIGALGGALGTISLWFLLSTINDSASATSHEFWTVSELVWAWSIWPANIVITVLGGNSDQDAFGWTRTALGVFTNACLGFLLGRLIVALTQRKKTQFY